MLLAPCYSTLRHNNTFQKISSLCSQLANTYSANRKASFPFSLLFTSLSGRIKTRLERNGANRWTEVEWWTEGYEHLWTLSEQPVQGQSPDMTYMDEPETPESTSLLNARARAKGPQDTVVYLTADSEEELSEIKPEETYIIGGISDLSNRYKVGRRCIFHFSKICRLNLCFQSLCLNKAKENGIRTARLPIERYLASLPTRKVLTVNQIFEIMVKWVETRSWEEALYAVVPERKFQAGESNIDITFSW
jgi:tRNA (guanine9-N1)-methyltransferase